MRITDLIKPEVFPSGDMAVKIADNKTIPISDNKYLLKIAPPMHTPSA
jgi:hypothetical protein